MVTAPDIKYYSFVRKWDVSQTIDPTCQQYTQDGIGNTTLKVKMLCNKSKPVVFKYVKLSQNLIVKFWAKMACLQ